MCYSDEFVNILKTGPKYELGEFAYTPVSPKDNRYYSYYET